MIKITKEKVKLAILIVLVVGVSIACLEIAQDIFDSHQRNVANCADTHRLQAEYNGKLGEYITTSQDQYQKTIEMLQFLDQQEAMFCGK